MSAAGVDEAPEARWVTPALTAVRRTVAEMAAPALRLLLRMMDGHRPDSTRTELPTRWVARADTVPPRLR